MTVFCSNMPVHLWKYGNHIWIYLFTFHADTCLFSTNSSIWIKTEKKNCWQLHTDTAKLWICGWTALIRQTGIWLFQAQRNISLKLINNTHFTGDVKLLRIAQLCCISAAVDIVVSSFCTSSLLSKKLPWAADKLLSVSSSNVLKQFCCLARTEWKQCI